MADAGWLPDPLTRHELRYWDGSAWTEHVSDQGATSVAPLLPSEPPPPPPAPATAPPPPPAGSTSAAGGGGGGGRGSWKDKLRSAAVQAADQGKKLGEQAKTAVGEQQDRRLEQLRNDPSTLWFGQSVDAASRATGMSKATYRITKDRVWIDSGLLGTKSESVPLWAVRDIDIRQNVLQRGKDIGDVVLRLEDPAYSVDQSNTFDLRGHAEAGMTSGEVVLDNIQGPYQVHELLMPLVSEARSKKTMERQSQYLHVNPGMAAVAGSAAPQPPPAAAAPVDVADQLRKLANLRDEGILSDEEFAAQKARLLGG